MFRHHQYPDNPGPFNVEYSCYSMAMLPEMREDVDHGGKIMLPPSALDHLTRLNTTYPMLFKLSNKKKNRMTHAGVLEFIAETGRTHLPYWMMKYLELDEGDVINIENVTLPVATYSKFQPQSVDFLEISNPKAVLENCLRNFACLTTGDKISIVYNERVYELLILETKPGLANSIIECDMNVDFVAPVGYIDPNETNQEEKESAINPADLLDEACGFYPFKGTGNRLDGKKKKRDSEENSPPPKRPYRRGIPDYSFNIGELNFIRDSVPVPQNNKENEPDKEFQPFSGEGFLLKNRKD